MLFLEFDAYSPRAQCAVALVAALSIAERAVMKLDAAAGVRSLEKWEDFLDLARAAPPFVSQGEMRYLDAFFLKPPQAIVRLNNKNPKTTERVAKLIAKTVGDHFFKPDAPLSMLMDGSINAPDLAELARKLAKFANTARFLEVIEKTDPDSLGPGECVIRFFRQAFGTSTAEHPTFPSMKIFDLRGLKAEFHSLYPRGEKHDPNPGLFAVVREARGWASRRPKDVNLLVRDLLWLLPHEKEGNPAHHGLYMSVIDNDAFVINEKLEIDAPNAIASGRLESKDGLRQRCKLIFAEFETRHPLEVRDGVIAGTTNELFFAAWKVLVIRPDWQDSALQTVIYQCTANQASDAVQFACDVGAMGVLFSEKLRAKRPEAQDRREAFRSLTSHTVPEPVPSKTFGEFASQELEKTLMDVISKAHEELESMNAMQLAEIDIDAKTKQLRDNVILALQEFVKQKWHLIEPAQIITYKQTRHTKSQAEVDPETRASLVKLLERVGICRYSDA